jgi:flavin-dependent dehydrogenase
MKVDIVIVGARCAGAATALLLARAGARVLVLEKGRYGADALSTHALMRGGVLQLHRWGVLPAIVAAGTPPVHATTFIYSGQEITVPIEPKFGVTALYAPRRTLLDRTLVDAAIAAGAEVRYGVRVDDVIRDNDGRVSGVMATVDGTPQRFEADMVVGADGLHSTIAQRVAAANVLEGQHSTGVLFAYWEGLQAGSYEWWFRPGAGAGAIPTNDGATCVFVTIPPGRFREEARATIPVYRRLLREVSPLLDARLEDARQVEPVRSFGGHPGFIKTSTGPGWALVGDAGYFKDPFTAHGITDALRDAELLARAVVQGTGDSLANYALTRLDLSRRLFEVTDEVASFDWTEDQLQALHRAFSSEMSREVRALAALEPLPGLASPAGAADVAGPAMTD